MIIYIYIKRASDMYTLRLLTATRLKTLFPSHKATKLRHKNIDELMI